MVREDRLARVAGDCRGGASRHHHAMNANDITVLIDNYTPSTLVAADWHAIGADVRSWVHAAEPGHPHRARQLLAAATQLAAWCREAGIPLSADTALRSTTIERYCALAEQDGRHSATTRATIRARLRYLARAQRISGQPPPPPNCGSVASAALHGRRGRGLLPAHPGTTRTHSDTAQRPAAGRARSRVRQRGVERPTRQRHPAGSGRRRARSSPRT